MHIMFFAEYFTLNTNITLYIIIRLYNYIVCLVLRFAKQCPFHLLCAIVRSVLEHQLLCILIVFGHLHLLCLLLTKHCSSLVHLKYLAEPQHLNDPTDIIMREKLLLKFNVQQTIHNNVYMCVQENFDIYVH